jgi:hypothetical protein
MDEQAGKAGLVLGQANRAGSDMLQLVMQSDGQSKEPRLFEALLVQDIHQSL